MVAVIQKQQEREIPEYITPYTDLKNPIVVQGVATNGAKRRVFDLVADGNRQIRPQLDDLIPEHFGTGWAVEPGNWWTEEDYEF